MKSGSQKTYVCNGSVCVFEYGAALVSLFSAYLLSSFSLDVPCACMCA